MSTIRRPRVKTIVAAAIALWLLVIAAVLLLAAPAHAQASFPTAAAGVRAPGSVPLSCNALGAACAPARLTEVLALVTANAPAAAQPAFGGDYVFAQTCSSYGTLTLDVRGPDGASFQTMSSKTASDASGGTAVRLGAGAVVRASVSGTAGCAATLSRIPG